MEEKLVRGGGIGPEQAQVQRAFRKLRSLEQKQDKLGKAQGKAWPLVLLIWYGFSAVHDILLETISVDAIGKCKMIDETGDADLKRSQNRGEQPSFWGVLKLGFRRIVHLAFRPAIKAWENALKSESLLQGLLAIIEFIWSSIKLLPTLLQLPLRMASALLHWLYAKADDWTESKDILTKVVGWVLKVLLLGRGIERCFHRVANVIGYITNLLDGLFRVVFSPLKFIFEFLRCSKCRSITDIFDDLFNDFIQSGLGRVLKNTLRVLPEVGVIGLYVASIYFPFLAPVAVGFDKGVALFAGTVVGLSSVIALNFNQWYSSLINWVVNRALSKPEWAPAGWRGIHHQPDGRAGYLMVFQEEYQEPSSVKSSWASPASAVMARLVLATVMARRGDPEWVTDESEEEVSQSRSSGRSL